MPSLSLLALSLLVSSSVTAAAALPPPNSIPVTVVNHAGFPIELFWIDTFNVKDKSKPALVAQSEKPMRNGSDSNINSYNGHSFRAKFYKGHPSDAFVDFTKGPKEESVTITYDGHTMRKEQLTPFDEVVRDFKQGMSVCGKPTKDGFHECLVDSIYKKTQEIIDQTAEVTKFRNLMSERLRNYTCADPNMNTSQPISSLPIEFGGKKMVRHVLLDNPEAKIWYVKDFITPEECGILLKHGRPRLMRATVAAQDGSSVVSEHRKANQAHYDLKHEIPDDPLGKLYNRILHVTNVHAGYDLKAEGQEGYTIIQYNPEDEYTPHCDGSCDATPHISGGRIATAVMYCEVPKVGGATTFTKADIFVKPEVGMATFFSYLGPNDRMDHGLTEHSGCPVVEGEKWIATAWMRKGVSNSNPWNLLDPSGTRILMD